MEMGIAQTRIRVRPPLSITSDDALCAQETI
jgi:hypothetical protein